MRDKHGGFHFEASWLEEEKCAEVVGEAWKAAMEAPQCSSHEALKEVARGLKHWSTNVLGDLEKRVKKNKKRMLKHADVRVLAKNK